MDRYPACRYSSPFFRYTCEAWHVRMYRESGTYRGRITHVSFTLPVCGFRPGDVCVKRAVAHNWTGEGKKPEMRSPILSATLLVSLAGIGHGLSAAPYAAQKATLRRRSSPPAMLLQQQALRRPEAPIQDPEDPDDEEGFSYVKFAKQFPFVNNVMIATAKTAAADLLAQVAISGTPIDAIDWQRSFLFCAFGALCA